MDVSPPRKPGELTGRDVKNLIDYVNKVYIENDPTTVEQCDTLLLPWVTLLRDVYQPTLTITRGSTGESFKREMGTFRIAFPCSEYLFISKLGGELKDWIRLERGSIRVTVRSGAYRLRIPAFNNLIYYILPSQPSPMVDVVSN